MPKISIIIPVYKVENYLARCLNSLLKQTFIDFEVILVDDCSPDNSGAICDEYAAKDSRFKVIHAEKNGGLSVARNLGLAQSKGEYIAFIDSDDYVAPEYLQVLLDTLEKNQADIAQCGFYEVIDDKEPEKVESQAIMKKYTKEDTYEFLYGVGDANVFNFIVWNKLFKAKILQSIHFENGLRNEDVIFTSYALMKARVVALSNIMAYYYCRRSDSIMGLMQKDKRDMIISHLLAYRKVAEFAMNDTQYIQTLSNARLAAYYVSAIKAGLLKRHKELKTMLKEDKKRFAFKKNKKIPFMKRMILAIGG